ncbi:MAG TPA: hypothetical protein VF618_21935 [Thermoanaerobaculia bacterium]
MHLDKLLSIASDPLGPALIRASCEESVPRSVYELLAARNGFYLLAKAVHVFPLSAHNILPMDAERWNAPVLWKAAYGGLWRDMFVFAENALGWQFGMSAEGVYAFDPETAAVEWMGRNLEEWGDTISKRFEHFTRFGVVHRWQTAFGPIPDGVHLVPRLPVVRGGSYDVANFLLTDAVTSLRMRARLAITVDQAADGTSLGIVRGRLRSFGTSPVAAPTCDRCRLQRYVNSTWLGQH